MALIIDPVQTAQYLVDAEFESYDVVTMGAIFIPETTNERGKIDVHAFHLVDNPESVAYLSVDWGAAQNNDYWQRRVIPEVLAELGIDPELPWSMSLMKPEINIKVARRVFVEAGGLEEPWLGYQRWESWKHNLHMPFMEDAFEAARAVGVNV